MPSASRSPSLEKLIQRLQWDDLDLACLLALPRLRSLGLDFVSTGALMHHSVWADIGLDWRP